VVRGELLHYVFDVSTRWGPMSPTWMHIAV
jgi:hypothetical protein